MNRKSHSQSPVQSNRPNGDMDRKNKVKEAEGLNRQNRVDRPSYRRDRPAPYQRNNRNIGPRPSNSTRLPPYNRVFVHNIAYEEKWQGLKDTFRDKVGEVTYVELFTDESGKSRGYGVVEFKTKELCEKAVKIMNHFEINNRKILVREDYNGELCRKMLLRDGHPAALRMSAPPLPGLPPPMPGTLAHLPPMPPPMGMGSRGSVGNVPMPNLSSIGNDIGVNRMNDMPRSGPIGNTVFVANLDYKVTYSKLKEVFALAGRVVKVDLMLDKDNKSRGMATVTFDEPMEAAQAISMLNNQKLYDRTMIVKMDKDNNREKSSGNELPSGLSGIGPSLNLRNRENMSGISSAIGGFGDSGLNNSSLGALSSNPLALSGFAAASRGLPDLNKRNSPQTSHLAAGLSALTQQASRLTETLQSNPGNLGLNSLGALSGLGELARLGLSRVGGGRENLDHRILEEQRARLLTTTQSSGYSDRERIEMDIARVDNRIRDIDRSLAANERSRTLGQPLPPMPPPMNSVGGRVPGTTVFVRNLPYSLTWQNLRDKFSRCGRVLFAEIKMDNGKSRGFGNVRFETPEQAQAAVLYLDGMAIDGRNINVHIDNRN